MKTIFQDRPTQRLEQLKKQATADFTTCETKNREDNQSNWMQQLANLESARTQMTQQMASIEQLPEAQRDTALNQLSEQESSISATRTSISRTTAKTH